MIKVGYLIDSATVVEEEIKGTELFNRIKQVSFVVIDPETKEYSEKDITITPEQLTLLFQKFPKSGLKTSLTPRIQIEKALDELLEKVDYVIGFPIAQGLSNQRTSFIALSQEEKYKGKFFSVGAINTSTSAIEDIKILEKLFTKEKTLNQEILTKVLEEKEKLVSHRILLYVSNLDRLLLSGRISKVKALIGKLAKLKVAFTLDKEKVFPLDKSRSIFQLVDATVKETAEKIRKKIVDSKVEATIFVYEVEKEIKDKVISLTKNFVDKVRILPFPSIILVHLGKGTIAIQLTSKKKGS